MLDAALYVLATVAVWTIGAERCGKAVARHFYGRRGYFQVGWQHDEDDEDERDLEAIGYHMVAEEDDDDD